jgi:hypothetical protein
MCFSNASYNWVKSICRGEIDSLIVGVKHSGDNRYSEVQRNPVSLRNRVSEVYFINLQSAVTVGMKYSGDNLLGKLTIFISLMLHPLYCGG